MNEIFDTPTSDLVADVVKYNYFIKLAVFVSAVISCTIFVVSVKASFDPANYTAIDVYGMLERTYGRFLTAIRSILLVVATFVVVFNKRMLSFIIIACLVSLFLSYGLAVYVEIGRQTLESVNDIYQLHAVQPKEDSLGLVAITIIYVIAALGLIAILYLDRTAKITNMQQSSDR